ncbi:MAG: MBL fold metallo-hydrolase [Spirochaetales bacterium]
MAIKLYSLGAAQEVTGSKHIIEVNGRIVMIDCGAFQGRRKEADRKNRSFDFDTEKLDAVVLTHAHYDHCGLLPVLTKNGFTGKIFATSATRSLTNLILKDSAHIQARDAEYLSKQAAKRNEVFDWKPLFTETDVEQTMNQIQGILYNEKVSVSDGIDVEFFEAGHILGSATVLVTIQQHKNTMRILYSGDLGRKNKPIIRDPAVDMPAPDYIFLESTYGKKRHKDADVVESKLIEIIRRAVETKGKIIIPAFAIERTQELIYQLHLLTDKKLIPKIPIYVDSPMATNATAIFKKHSECYDRETQEAFSKHHKNPFGFNELIFTQSVAESKSLNDKKGPMIIISADGMCEAGRIVHHVANNVSNPNNTLLIVGYMAEHTLGRRILEGAKEVRIMGDWYDVNARIEKINAFSAHTDCEEAVQWLDAIDTSRLKKIFMVHGEPSSQEGFQEYLISKGYSNIEIVQYGKTYTV